MKRAIFICLAYIILFMPGCKCAGQLETPESPVVLWGRSFSPDDVDKITRWNLTYGKGFGLLGYKTEHYRKKDFGLKPTRFTVLGNSSHYALEFEFQSEIREIIDNYGNTVQLQIRILGGPPPHSNIFTTGNFSHAILFFELDEDNLPIVVELDKDDKVTSVLWDTPKSGYNKLNVRIDKKSIRIFLPMSMLPESSSNWWLKDKSKGKPHFHCYLFSRLALPPVAPIQSNIEDLFLVPSLFLTGCPEIKGSRGIRIDSWIHSCPRQVFEKLK